MFRQLFPLAMLLTVFANAFAQETTKETPPKAPEYIDVTLWVAYVVGDGTVAGADKVVELDRYPTKEEANVRVQQWQNENKNSNRIADSKEITVKVPLRKPSAGKRPELVRPVVSAQTPGGGKKLIRVRVYELIDGKFKEQSELAIETDDYEKASEYFWKAKATQGYTASWNDPSGRKPKVVGAAKPWVDVEGTYNKPKVDEPNGNTTSKPAVTALADTKWRFRSGSIINFKADQSILVAGKDLPTEDGTWKMSGDVLEFTINKPQYKNWHFKGKVSGNQLVGQYWFEGDSSAKDCTVEKVSP